MKYARVDWQHQLCSGFSSQGRRNKQELPRLVDQRIHVRCQCSEDKPMDAKLSEQIQALIDTVEEAETQMASLATAMSKSSGDVRPECQHIQDEIGRVLDELGYIRYIAVLREAEQATSHTPNKTLRD